MKMENVDIAMHRGRTPYEAKGRDWHAAAEARRNTEGCWKPAEAETEAWSRWSLQQPARQGTNPVDTLNSNW